MTGQDLYKTTDSGASWSLQNSNMTSTGGYVLEFVNETTGFYITGYPIASLYKTTDSGNNWNLINSGINMNSGYVISFVSDTQTSLFNNTFQFDEKKLINMIDLNGRVTKMQYNTIIFEVYIDGTVEKKIFFK